MKQVQLKSSIQPQSYIELTCLSTLFSTPDKNGDQKILKKDIPSRISIYIEDIQGHEEVLNDSGKIRKNVCRIHHRGIGQLIIKESYQSISLIKQQTDNPQHKQAGFK